jgi:hypothetical protein
VKTSNLTCSDINNSFLSWYIPEHISKAIYERQHNWQKLYVCTSTAILNNGAETDPESPESTGKHVFRKLLDVYKEVTI